MRSSTLTLCAALAAAACMPSNRPLRPTDTAMVLRPERGPNDVVNKRNVDAFGVTWNPASVVVESRGGLYKVEWGQDAWGTLGNQWRLAPASDMQAQATTALTARHIAMTGDTTAAVKALIPSSGEGAPPNFERPLVAAKIPFRLIAPDGQPVARVVMLQRHAPGNATDSVARNSRLVGSGGDTVRVTIPPDVWMPGDSLYVFEQGRYAMRLILSCAPARATCNPLTLGTRGGTGYLPYQRGWAYLLNFTRR